MAITTAPPATSSTSWCTWRTYWWRPCGGSTTYRILTDHLKTPRKLIDVSNATVWSWDGKEAFGSTGPSGSITFNLRFPGQYADTETGLFNNGFRDYAPAWWRYVESDPTGLSGGLNTYGYTANNPVSNIDMYGESAQDVRKITQLFHQEVLNMTVNGLRLSDPSINNFCAAYGSYFCGMSPEQSDRLLNCNGQSNHMIIYLNNQKYDDGWKIVGLSGLYHYWGVAVSSDPDDPVIYFDTRSNNISYNDPCPTCHGFFGSDFDSFIQGDNKIFNNEFLKIQINGYPPEPFKVTK